MLILELNNGAVAPAAGRVLRRLNQAGRQKVPSRRLGSRNITASVQPTDGANKGASRDKDLLGVFELRECQDFCV